MSILEKFTVIDLIKTRSASVATITGNVLKFNNQTASELHEGYHRSEQQTAFGWQFY